MQSYLDGTDNFFHIVITIFKSHSSVSAVLAEDRYKKGASASFLLLSSDNSCITRKKNYNKGVNKEMISYYEPATEEVYEDVKSKAIEIWSTYDNKYGYAADKIKRVRALENKDGGLMAIVNMFDRDNQYKLSTMISEESNQVIRTKLLSGGASEDFIIFK